MFRPKFKLYLSNEHFYPDTVICLGSQMSSIAKFLKTSLTPHTWYGADIDAVGPAIRKYDLSSENIKIIGSDSSLIKICSEVDQFLSGVFIAIQHDYSNNATLDAEITTEDDSFRALNIEGVLIEIRAFDTSFFEIFSENEMILKKLSARFKSSHGQESEYTWSDLVAVKLEAPKQFHPGGIGVISGMSKIQFEEIAKKYHSKLGDWIYTVKLADGRYIEVPGSFLVKYQ